MNSSNPHDQLLERAWQNSRQGLAICQKDEAARRKGLDFSIRASAVAPAHMQRWIEILHGGHAGHVATLFSSENFFDLSSEEQSWWDQLLQSAPFAPSLRRQSPKKRLKIKKQQKAMTLEQFDHICRAAAAVAGVKKIYAFGANAILPWLAQAGHPLPLPGFAPSREVDISSGDEKLDTLIDGAIGELSAFDEAFSIYAHGVSLEAFQAPANWQRRAGTRTEPVSGIEIIAPHPHDLIISKLVAGRPKDFDFANAVTQLFPITDAEIDQLLDEFRGIDSEAERRLGENIEIWKRKARGSEMG